MTTLQTPTLPSYERAPPTKVKLDYADLLTIDLSLAETSEGRIQLGRQVHDAMRNQGFFYVINHGLCSVQTKRMFDIADMLFSQMSNEEKETFKVNVKATGSSEGFKRRQFWHVDGGVRDQIEAYNMHRNVYRREHPSALRAYLPEIHEFVRNTHENILHQVLRLLALGLELPEDTFVNFHRYSDLNGDSLFRFMKYYSRTEEDENKSKNVWLKGHTDFGSITILHSQPVVALQILAPNGTWKWVQHVENALVINTGDAMDFLSGGYYRATIHRVVQPPLDQQEYTRLGVIYFGQPNEDLVLEPLLQSSKVRGVGSESIKRFNGNRAPTVKEWRTARILAFGQTELVPSDDGVEEDVINGVVVKYYN